LVRCFYRVTALGLKNCRPGGFLLGAKSYQLGGRPHPAARLPAPIRYVIDQEYYHKRILHPILRTIGCIPISKRQSHAAVRAAAGKNRRRRNRVCVPEGELERRGTLLRLQRGYEVIARHAKAQVVPVWLDQLWGSIFSFQGGKFFRKVPEANPVPCYGRFGKPLEAKAADVATVREELLKLGEFCFSRRPSLDRHLAEDCVRGLKRRPFATAVIDGIDHTAAEPRKIARRGGRRSAVICERIS
jgi:acyl-[acyl-carrier-protein]-phospholipid O-acyltransferase/long-chain-fatty-acid--[acyl-carrier-protein] ligase